MTDEELEQEVFRLTSRLNIPDVDLFALQDPVKLDYLELLIRYEVDTASELLKLPLTDQEHALLERVIAAKEMIRPATIHCFRKCGKLLHT